MKKYIYILLIGFSLYAQTRNPDLLQCTLSVEKDTFLVDEPIYVEFKETNIGNVDVLTQSLNFTIREFYSATLLGPDGSRIPQDSYHADVFFSDPIEGFLLKPGESQYCVIPIHNWFGNRDIRPVTYQQFYLPAGRYSFKITHYTNNNYVYEESILKQKNVDKMPITSNELVFYIIDPQTPEQEDERQLFMKCKTMGRWVLHSDVVKEYFDNYSESNLFYKYDLLYRLIMCMEPPTNTQLYYTTNEILDRMKNSFISYYQTDVGLQIYDDLKNDNRPYTPRIESCQRLAIKYPNTQLEKYCNYMARSYERNKENRLKEGKSE